MARSYGVVTGVLLVALQAGLAAALGGCNGDDIDSLPEAQQQVLFYEPFEDGDAAGWTVGSGAYTRAVVPGGADGSARSFTLIGGNNFHHDGVQWFFSPGIQPTYIRYFVRSADTTAADGYFVIGDATYTASAGEIAFGFLDNLGNLLFVNGVDPDLTMPYTANTWYRVELKNIDWTAKTLDVWVNGTLLGSGFAFRGPSVASLTTISLYNYYPSQAWWDQILLAR